MQSYNPSSKVAARRLVDATSSPAISAVGATGPSSLRKDQSVIHHPQTPPTTIQSTHLNTRFPQQTTLEVRHRPGHLVPHRRLAVLSARGSCTARSRRAASTSSAGAGALGRKRAFSGVAVVADAAGVGGCLPGGGRGAGERVSGRGFRDAGGLGLFAG